MSLKEKAGFYYGTQGKHCAEAILRAADEVYALGMNEDEFRLFSGFSGGMGCGSTCGALTGAIGVLSKRYGHRDDFRALCGNFVTAFTDKLGCGTTDCGPLAVKYRTEANRCLATVELAAEALEDYIDQLDGKAKPRPTGEGCTLAPEEIKRAKSMGFLHQKGTNKFNGRVITRNGRITVQENEIINEAAKRYGDGYMMMTSRLTIEVSGINYADIDAFRNYVAQAGLEIGGTGSKVRPIVCCKGTTCQYGNYDTYALSEEIHERFFQGYRAVTLPHKFKIAVGGCPNNCVKPNLNDVGIVGANAPEYNQEICRGCKRCQMELACPVQAAKVVEGKLRIDPDLCNSCGRCIAKCPFHCADQGTAGWKIYVGGRWGKKVAHGQMLRKLFTDKEDVLNTVEKSILLFRDLGLSGERFADTIDRLGFEQVEALLLSNDLLERKDLILGLDVTGGASC
jgi:C_GCAxxG_C_C family probable redox protein